MRLLVISPLVLLSATYFSCYVNTWSGTSYLEVHVFSNAGNVGGAKAEVWSDTRGVETLVATQTTDATGRTVFEIQPGTSEVRVHLGQVSDYVSETVTLQKGETKRVELCTTCDR